jgi:hypothetical protein
VRLAVLLLCGACGRFGFGASEAAPDAVPGPDARVADCDPEVGADSVALFSFDDGLGTDATQQHAGQIVGAVTPGEPRCGTSAVDLAGGHIRIADSPAFDLNEGSIELFFRTPTPALDRLQGIVSRDANGTTFDGHLTIGLATNGQLWLRIQRMLNDLSVFRCSNAPLPVDSWVHIGASFGPPGLRLWIDHVEQTGGTIEIFDSIHDCSLPHTFGIDGNNNALVLGGLLIVAPEGDPAPEPTDLLDNGSLDHVHLRSTWRDFSVF